MEYNNELESDEIKKEECCGICGDPLSKKFVYKLPCNHEFHYGVSLKHSRPVKALVINALIVVKVLKF